MNASLLFDLSDENPIFQFFLGNDSSTHRKVAFVASIYDAMFLSALVSVSFRFAARTKAASAAGTNTTTTAAAPKSRTRVPFTFFRKSHQFVSGQTPYYKSFVFAFGTMWTGHFLVDSSLANFEKRYKKLRSKISESLPSSFNNYGGNDDDDDDENDDNNDEGAKTSPSATSAEEDISRKTKSPLNNNNNTNSNNSSNDNLVAAKAEQEKQIQTVMSRIPSGFFRSTASEIIRAALLAPFDAVAVGIFSSFHSGKPKCADTVVDLIWKQRRFDILLPTVCVTMLVRLLPEIVKKRAEANKELHQEVETRHSLPNQKHQYSEFLTRFFLLPIICSFAMRTVSHRWSVELAAAAASSSSQQSTSTTTAKTGPSRRIRSLHLVTLPVRATARVLSLLSTSVVSMFANIYSLPAAVCRATSRSAAALITSAAYLALCQFAAMVVVAVCIGAESAHLKRSGDDGDSSCSTIPDAKSRSRRGKFLTYCSAVNLPSHFTELAFAASASFNSNNNGKNSENRFGLIGLLLGCVRESCFVAYRGECSAFGRDRIVANLVESCQIERKELTKALIPFRLGDFSNSALASDHVDDKNKKNKNNTSNMTDDEEDEKLDDLRKRKILLEMLLERVCETEKILTSKQLSGEFWSTTGRRQQKQVDDLDDKRQNAKFKPKSKKTLPYWLQLEYEILKVTPSILNNSKLTSEEHTELLTNATLKLLRSK